MNAFATRPAPRAPTPRLWSGSSSKAGPHPEQGFRSCIGILRLAKTHGPDRLEAACERALEIGAQSYSSLNSILKNNLDRRTAPKSSKGATDGPAIDHANIRGSRYFH